MDTLCSFVSRHLQIWIAANKSKLDFRDTLIKQRHVYNQCSVNRSLYNHIGSVMVNMLALSAVDHGFKPWSGQTKDYKMACSIKEKEQRLVGSES